MSDQLEDFYSQQPQWEPSGVDDALEYAYIEVPMDYTNPGGRRLTIAIGRIKATKPEKRRGVLLALNGGPGGEGTQGRRMPLRYKGTEVNEVYDLIGLDPRGLEASTRLIAKITPAKSGFDSRPPDEMFPVIAEDMRIRELGCQEGDDGLRPFINTRNCARDIDVFRAVLGEEKINYIGHADGTHVGALYGSMFAHRLDRSVLDCSRNPYWNWRDQWKAQSVAFRENVELWAEWVADRHSYFEMGYSTGRIMNVVEDVAAKLAEAPVYGLNRTLFDGAMGTGACYRGLWDELAWIVKELRWPTSEENSADAAKAALLLSGLIFQWKTINETDRSGVTDAVTLEDEWPTDLEFYYSEMREFREKYPYGYGIIRVQPWVGIYRTFQPAEPPLTPDDVHRTGYPRGVVVHSTANTVLRYEGGVAMAKKLGNFLITVADEGHHEIFSLGRNACVDETVTRYLVDGELPEGDEMVCEGLPRPDIKPGQTGQAPAGQLFDQTNQFVEEQRLWHRKW
jgi:pimeloyl-ACP methyl ester carboxylesterase